MVGAAWHSVGSATSACNTQDQRDLALRLEAYREAKRQQVQEVGARAGSQPRCAGGTHGARSKQSFYDAHQGFFSAPAVQEPAAPRRKPKHGDGSGRSSPELPRPTPNGDNGACIGGATVPDRGPGRKRSGLRAAQRQPAAEGGVGPAVHDEVLSAAGVDIGSASAREEDPVIVSDDKGAPALLEQAAEPAGPLPTAAVPAATSATAVVRPPRAGARMLLQAAAAAAASTSYGRGEDTWPDIEEMYSFDLDKVESIVQKQTKNTEDTPYKTDTANTDNTNTDGTEDGAFKIGNHDQKKHRHAHQTAR